MADKTIVELQAEAYGCACEKGWWDDQKVEGGVSRMLVEALIPEKLALIHSEVSEALEDFRVEKLETILRSDGKPEGFPSELADVIVRVLDLAGALGIDMQHELELKMKFNRTRSHRHGGKRC